MKWPHTRAVVDKRDVPKDMKILPCMWAMKRKRRIDTREVYKWKARLNLHGGKQELGVNYWETYAATLSWPPIQFFMTLALINNWSNRQIDFTLAYPQADAECELYMDIRRTFSQIVKRILNEDALITITYNSNFNIDFKPNFPNSSKADGSTYYKILCIAFDLAILINTLLVVHAVKH